MLTQDVKKFLRKYEIKPKKRFGQSFLVDENVINRMITYANVTKKDTVIDIGSGLGYLTELLSKKAEKIISVEYDTKLANILQEKFSENSKIELYRGDFLKFNLQNKYNKVVSSPPYSIASKIIFKLLADKFGLAVLLLQKEFATRMTAIPGSRDYSRLTVMTYIRAETESLEEVPNTAFYPKPKISSTIIRMKMRKTPFKILNPLLFEKIVKFLFTQKKKKLKNVLKKFFECEKIDPEKILNQIPLLEKRVFTLHPEEFNEIVETIDQKYQQTNITQHSNSHLK